VDLWGGYRNAITQAPWGKDTLVNVFSTTKGVASLAVAVAASRGLISYDAKVADFWPEFAQGGKDAVIRSRCFAAPSPGSSPEHPRSASSRRGLAPAQIG
jgi:CubicO group peptidase (beta-lactamase class C family)